MPELLADVEPPQPSPGAIRIVACGGLGEIGRNMMAIKYESEVLIVDCGVLFPSEDQPGVDLILPDFSILRKLDAAPRYLVLTHGHEDHIGAISYLLRQYPDVTLVGSRLTLALAGAKARQSGLHPETIEVTEGDTRELGAFRATFLAVAHSVPDGLAVSIRVGGLHLLHTGDFKLDSRTLDGRQTDLAGFAREAASGIDFLMSDSTNADVRGTLPGERDITDNINNVFLNTSGRVIFACFASNVHRVQQAINATVRSGRQFAFIGRSMIRNMGIARDLGFLTIPAGAQVDLDAALNSSREDVALICTGSQGEPLAALSRMARDDHPIKLHAGDLVVLSARLIPGNEEDVFRVVNSLSRKGVDVLHPENSVIHASGHAPAVDLAHILSLTKPRYLLPIHGEWRHLRAHARIARDAEMSDDQVILLDNGDALDVVDGQPLVVGKYPYSNIYVDGGTIGLVDEATLRERRRLADSGVVSVALIVDATSGQLVVEPVFSLRGVPVDPFDSAETGKVADIAAKRWLESAAGDFQQLERMVRRAIEKWVYDAYSIRPVVLVSVVKAPGA
jgi:ribonuclease J